MYWSLNEASWRDVSRDFSAAECATQKNINPTGILPSQRQTAPSMWPFQCVQWRDGTSGSSPFPRGCEGHRATGTGDDRTIMWNKTMTRPWQDHEGRWRAMKVVRVGRKGFWFWSKECRNYWRQRMHAQNSIWMAKVKDICFHHDPRSGQLCSDSACGGLKVDLAAISFWMFLVFGWTWQMQTCATWWGTLWELEARSNILTLWRRPW